MSLLSFERVTKRSRRGRLERIAVRDVSLEVQPAELLAVRGPRRSGRSTLLRLAAGMEPPDEGIVRFEGRDLARVRDEVLGSRLGYCRASFGSSAADLAVEYAAHGLLAQHVPPKEATRRAEAMLARVGADHCASLACYELSAAERVRVMIASALVSDPVLLVIDEPTNGVDLLERDPLLALLRSIANEGVAVLMSAGDAQGLSGVDRSVSLDNGELRGAVVPLGHVVPLKPSEASADAGSRTQRL